MRRSHWQILLGLFAAAPLLGAASTAGAAELGPGIQTVSEREQSEKNDEDQTDTADSSSEDQQSDGQDSGDRDETRDDGNLDSGAPGLELGSDSSETDRVLADFDENRDADAESSADSSNDGGSQTIALSDDSADPHPCEPYPSCTRADLGSREGVDATPFQKVARKNADAIRKCYTSQLEQNADLSGRLVLEFTVTPEGEPTDVQVEDSTIDSDSVAECAVEAVAEWSFPKPAEYGYDSLTVKHPYTFRTDD